MIVTAGGNAGSPTTGLTGIRDALTFDSRTWDFRAQMKLIFSYLLSIHWVKLPRKRAADEFQYSVPVEFLTIRPRPFPYTGLAIIAGTTCLFVMTVILALCICVHCCT